MMQLFQKQEVSDPARPNDYLKTISVELRLVLLLAISDYLSRSGL